MSFEEREMGDDVVLVLIIKCETRNCDKNIEHLKWVFSDPYFHVELIDNTGEEENKLMTNALKYSLTHKYHDKPCIIIKDSSVSNIQPGFDGGITDRIKKALIKANTAHLFFLCKWNDACEKHVDVSPNDPFESPKLKWSVKPTATQAIMYRPHGRDFILNSLINSKDRMETILNNSISDGKLLATVFVPNVIDFDTDLARTKSDYLKLNECSKTSENTQTTQYSVLLILIILGIILCVSWMILSRSS